MSRGVQTYAFEPEAQNYAVLNRNILLNGLTRQVTAYCLGVVNRSEFGILNLSEPKIGGSLHSFGERVDHNLQPSTPGHEQGCVSTTLDALVESGQVPVPQHIKIDIDGFEHQVIEGAMKTLSNDSVKSVLVELNSGLPQHMEIRAHLEPLGFSCGEDNWSKISGGKSGNCIFRRQQATIKVCSEAGPSEAQWAQIVENIKATTVAKEPFPHILARKILPDTVYQEIIDHLPPIDCYRFTGQESGEVAGTKTTRGTLDFTADSDLGRLPPNLLDFWQAMMAAGPLNRLTEVLLEKFGILSNLTARPNLKARWQLTRDTGGYELPVHIDMPRKLITAMFYLPTEAHESVHGTSLFRLKAETPRPHPSRPNRFVREDFKTVIQVPFARNTMTAFIRTDDSYHGVDSIGDDAPQRDILTLNLMLKR